MSLKFSRSLKKTQEIKGHLKKSQEISRNLKKSHVSSCVSSCFIVLHFISLYFILHSAGWNNDHHLRSRSLDGIYGILPGGQTNIRPDWSCGLRILTAPGCRLPLNFVQLGFCKNVPGVLKTESTEGGIEITFTEMLRMAWGRCLGQVRSDEGRNKTEVEILRLEFPYWASTLLISIYISIDFIVNFYEPLCFLPWILVLLPVFNWRPCLLIHQTSSSIQELLHDLFGAGRAYSAPQREHQVEFQYVCTSFKMFHHDLSLAFSGNLQVHWCCTERNWYSDVTDKVWKCSWHMWWHRPWWSSSCDASLGEGNNPEVEALEALDAYCCYRFISVPTGLNLARPFSAFDLLERSTWQPRRRGLDSRNNFKRDIWYIGISDMDVLKKVMPKG